MGDICIVYNPASFTGDFAMFGAGLLLGSELESAVLISLFTDELADPGDILPAAQRADPRGWWADTFEGDRIGSKLWQVFWRQTTQDTLNWIVDTAKKSLAWMLEDDPPVAASVTVDARFMGKGRIGMHIVITEPSGQKTPFTYVWQQES